MGRYNVSFNTLLNLIAIGDPVVQAYLRALMAPLVGIYQRFIEARKKHYYQLEHGTQVVHLEAVLNDTFDPLNRGIVVTDAPEIQPTLLSRTDELKPLKLCRTAEKKPIKLNRTADVEAGGPDFLIQVPASVVFDEKHMRAVVDYYRLASKHYYLIEVV